MPLPASEMHAAVAFRAAKLWLSTNCLGWQLTLLLFSVFAPPPFPPSPAAGKTRVAHIQRSCGYALRPTLSIDEIGKAVQVGFVWRAFNRRRTS